MSFVLTEPALKAVLVGLLLLGMSVWVGGFVVITVVARTVRATLAPPARVLFFRHFGRSFLPVAGAAMLAILLPGGLLLAARPWDGLSAATVVLALAVVLTTAVGIRQARAMTGLRRRSHAEPESTGLAAQVQRGARRAAALRTSIGVLTLALFIVAVAASAT